MKKQLHWIERSVLLALRKGRLSLEEVAKEGGLSVDSVRRALAMLARRGYVKVEEREEVLVNLGPLGERLPKGELPERRLVKAVLRLGGSAQLSNAVKEAELAKDEIAPAIGFAKRRGWIKVSGRGRGSVLTAMREPALDIDEELLLRLREGGLHLVEVPTKVAMGLRLLKARPRLVRVKRVKVQTATLTRSGESVARSLKPLEEVSVLTPELIRSGKWKLVKLREYDVEAPGPIFYPAKTHPVEQIIHEIREVFLQMGFTEVQGPLVETAFWNFDALFQPQDHPAREMMDTFYLLDPLAGKLPKRGLVDKVKSTHEDGWITGSKGWGYKWNAEEAKRLVLRTHTTAATIRFLASHPQPPVRVFSVDRVYRNEKVDRKHLAEFHQIEGIVMEEGANLRHLMGILKEFYRRLGLEKVQFWPSYFPYTEPSLQSTVYVKELNAWVELCGMGIFRPEVVEPLGIKHPVLAWGGGLERLIMIKLGVDDIRDLYKNELSWIRRFPHASYYIR